MNPLFASCGCWCISSERRYRRPKSIFTRASGNESGFTQPPLFPLLTPFLPFSPCIVSSHTLSPWSSAPGMPSHTFALKLIWLCSSPVRGSYIFSLCSNTMFSCFSSHCQKPVKDPTFLTDLKHSLTCKLSPSFVIYTRGRCPATARPGQLIFRSMA